MSGRLSSPEQLLRRLDEINEHVATFQQLTGDLAAIKRRFDGLQQAYDRIRTDTATIDRQWAEIKGQHDAILRRLNEQVGEWRDVRARLVAETERRLADFTNAQVATTEHRLHQLEGESEERLQALEQWSDESLHRLSAAYTAAVHKAEAEVTRLHAAREELGRTQLEVQAVVHDAVERLVGRQHTWADEERVRRSTYEQEQYRRLDDILQSHRLLDMRFREGEADLGRRIQAGQQELVSLRVATEQQASDAATEAAQQRRRAIWSLVGLGTTGILALAALIVALVALLM